MIRNRNAARSISHAHHASCSCHSFDQGKRFSSPAFCHRPPLLGLGGGTGAADGIRMRAAEWTTLLESEGRGRWLHAGQALFFPWASGQWASAQLPKGDANPFLWSRSRVKGSTPGQSLALCPPLILQAFPSPMPFRTLIK